MLLLWECRSETLCTNFVATLVVPVSITVDQPGRGGAFPFTIATIMGTTALEKESFWLQKKRSICLSTPIPSAMTAAGYCKISVRPKCVLKDLPQNLLFRSWHCPPPCVMASRRHLWLAHLIACNLLQHWALQFLHNGSNWMKENIKEKFMRVVGFFKQDFWLDSFKVFNIRKDQLSSMTQNASQASISSCAAA